MKCDYWASFLAHTFASPCFDREPKVKVVILILIFKFFFAMIINPNKLLVLLAMNVAFLK
jgi:hypothetical protein